MEIIVKCHAPKSVIGEYRFATFEELFRWLIHIKGSKMRIAKILYILAKNGKYPQGGTARFCIEIDSDFDKGYSLINDLARKVGLLRTWRLGDAFSHDETVWLQFAKELDNLSKDTKGG